MSTYTLIHQLLTLVEDFEAKAPGKDMSLQNFTGFLVNEIGKESTEARTEASDIRFGKNEENAQKMAFQLDNSIGRLVVYMSRYAKSYIKKALDGTPLQSAEDFTCLAILLTHDSLLKGDLINRNIQEKTSGTEVIKRLLSAELIRQWDDESDRRGKRVAITAKGRALLYEVFENMNQVGKIVTGDLKVTEKLTLYHLLQKLENFHYAIHENKTVTSMDDIQTLVTK